MITSIALPAGALALAPATGSASTSGHTSIGVPRDFSTIQAAVDAATPGATIHVGPGTYTEQLVITMDLDLRGTDADTTVIKSPPTLTPCAVHMPDHAPIASSVSSA
jgi:pectin methylesterase-like acyl-CoA thioesterase